MDTPHISTYDTGTSGVKSVSDLENCKHLKCPQGLHYSWDIICKPCKECEQYIPGPDLWLLLVFHHTLTFLYTVEP